MSKQQQDPGFDVPWYKQFWPWFIIALPASAVIAGFATLWIAIKNPDGMVLTDEEYQRVRSELKAQPPAQKNDNNSENKPEPETK